MKLPRFARVRAQRLVESPGELLRVVRKAREKLAAGGSARSLGESLEGLRTMLRLLPAWARGEYRGIRKAKLMLIAGAVVYFLMPADLIPDFIPISGFVDDAAVILWVMRAVREELAKFQSWSEAKDKDEEGEPTPQTEPVPDSA